MKHKTEALAAFALMYILSEYEVDQELKYTLQMVQ